MSARIGLIADDDAYYRMAVGAILTRRFGFSEVIEAASLDEALEQLSERTDVSAALFDLSVPGLKTPANLRAVREGFPQTRVAVISGSRSRSRSRRDMLLAFEAGVHGYMPKSLSIAELTIALETIFNGSIYAPPSLADIASAANEPAWEDGFSPPESPSEPGMPRPGTGSSTRRIPADP